MSTFKKLAEQSIPYIIIGMVIALAIGLLIMLSRIFIWGLILGAIIWFAVFIKNYLFPTPPDEKTGRIIEHDKKD